MSHADDPRAAALEIGARLTQAPSERLTDIAFARELNAQLGLAKAISWVDLAHTLCLAERGVIPRDPAGALVAALLELHAVPPSFAPSPEYGDLYTNREAWLAARTPAAGWFGVARARREALTTAYHLLLCDEALALGEALATAVEALSRLSLRHKDSLAPDYTYLQAAQPTTFGHYIQTFAWPMFRDLDRMLTLYERVDQCPAGIGSSNGSFTKQDRHGLSARLGFSRPVRHARDAMWQADVAIEACAVATAAAVNLDRLAEDLMIFASAEFGFVQLADRHARASKIMPQKRNPFALAFVRATANRLIGAQAAVAAASRTPSGQMDNRLFVYEAAPDALSSAAAATLLIAECMEDLRFDEVRALAALSDRSVCAGDLAERLMAATGADYRSAHGLVGRLIGRLEEQGRKLAEATLDDLRDALREADLSDGEVTQELLASALDPAACVMARTDFGGAASQEVAAMAEELIAAAREHRCAIDAARAGRKRALNRLHAEATAFARAAP
jgi:argininosuccinate lyase